MEPDAALNTNQSPLLSALRFWEPRRVLYNLLLTVVVFLWIISNWSHFRPALTLSSLAAMIVLAILANLCYCAAYLAEVPIQNLFPRESWRRIRWALWVAGTLLALLFENYWIADEIYPDPLIRTGGPQIFRDMFAMWSPHLASNMNFPTPLAVVGFLAACGGLVFGIAAALVFWFARRTKFARIIATIVVCGALFYFVLLFGFSLASRANIIARGQEKYFCEIDCHLAYSIASVQTELGPAATHYVITLRTRFDETTISPTRPKDAPLTPSPRTVRLLDDRGHEYSPASTAGTPLTTPLKPADSYTTQLEFDLPKDATGLKLLLNTVPGWPDHLVIGDENSWLHKKTYLAL